MAGDKDALTLEKLKIDDRLRTIEQQMEGKAVLLGAMADTLTRLDLKVGVQNGRISKLEYSRAAVYGVIGTIGFIASFIGLAIAVLNFIFKQHGGL